MPEHDNSHSELLPGHRYARGGNYDSGEPGSCGVIGCSRPIYADGLCVVHWGWKECVKPDMIYPELEGHRYPPGYYEVI